MTNRRAETGGIAEPTRAAIGRPVVGTRVASSGGRQWRRERWPVDLVALALAGAVTAATALAALAVTSTWVTPPRPGATHATSGDLGADTSTSAVWDEPLCCRETR